MKPIIKKGWKKTQGTWYTWHTIKFDISCEPDFKDETSKQMKLTTENSIAKQFETTLELIGKTYWKCNEVLQATLVTSLCPLIPLSVVQQLFELGNFVLGTNNTIVLHFMEGEGKVFFSRRVSYYISKLKLLSATTR